MLPATFFLLLIKSKFGTAFTLREIFHETVHDSGPPCLGSVESAPRVCPQTKSEAGVYQATKTLQTTASTLIRQQR